MAKTRALYQLRITLQDIQPTVWRQIQVWEDITMGKLHDILQVVMNCEPRGSGRNPGIRSVE